MDRLCTEEFLEAYRNTPCLWNTLDPCYRNGPQRRRALANLAATFEMNVDAVRKKIDNLRTYYRRELGKETDSVILGTHLYKSHWVHFETLAFLRGHFAKRNSRFSMDSAASGDFTEAADIADETGELPLGSASPVPFTPPGDGAAGSALTPLPSASEGATSSVSAGLHSDSSSLPCPKVERSPTVMEVEAAARRRGVKRCHCAARCWSTVVDGGDGCYEQLMPVQQSRVMPLRPAAAVSAPALPSPAVTEDHLDKFGQHMALMLRKLDMRTQALLLAKFSQLIADHMPAGP